MPSLSIGLSLRGRVNSASFSPATLFAASEPGVWYDPSDLTTLFQDSAGTTPVTAAGQPVGKMLDKSGRGNHATQATSTQRPIYGINPITGTRNLLTYTEQFENSYWTKTNATVTANNTASPSGTMTADKLVEDTTVISAHNLLRNYIIQSFSGTVTLSIYAKADTRSLITLYMDNTAGVSVAYEFNLSTLTSANTNANVAWSAHSAQIVDAGNGWRRCSITATRATTDVLSTRICLGKAGSTYAVGLPVYTGDGVSGLFIWGAQIELGSTATAYQSVVSQYEVTEAGVQSASYLAFDGVDDGMVTGTITPGIDKVQVFAGVRKLSDAAQAVIAEFSSTAGNPGAFSLQGPGPGATQLRFASGGSIPPSNVAVDITSSNAAPITRVLSGIGDISADNVVMRINGVQAGQNAADQGTGNFLAYPLYIGRRGGSSLPFNGRIYSLIVRFGPNLTTGQITATESWVNGETGAY